MDDYPDTESCLKMLKDQYVDTGCKFILNIKKNNKIMFDFGIDEEEIMHAWGNGLEDSADNEEEIEDKETSGEDGDCTWTLKDNHLIISGSGNMEDQSSSWTPWGKSMTDITIKEGVTSIGNYAFRLCTSLTSVTIPDSVTSIGNAAFDTCASLTSIEIPEGVTSIGEHAFWNCHALTNIHLPDSVTSIGEDAFKFCKSLTIICKKGSYAEQYAEQKNIPIKLQESLIKNKEDSLNECRSMNETIYNKEDHEVKTLFKNDKYIVELHPDAPKPYWVIDATVENPLHAEQCFYDEERAIRFAKEDSLNEGFFNDYIYLFPELTDDDIKMMAGYNIKYLGMNHGPDGSEDNWVVYGVKEDIEKYAEKYLGYELHPDYLYEYDDFAGEIVNEDLTETSNNLDYDSFEVPTSKGNLFFETRDGLTYDAPYGDYVITIDDTFVSYEVKVIDGKDGRQIDLEVVDTMEEARDAVRRQVDLL